MIHPFNENILAMENETPQTEREWRILFIGEIKKLSGSVEHLTSVVKDFKETEVVEIRKDIRKLQEFELMVMSSWKTIVAIAILFGGVLGILAKAFF